MQILYCFADESGDTTDKSPFIVTAIVIDNLVNIIEHLQIIEDSSKKGRIKWRKTSYERRVAYCRAIFSNDDLLGALRYAVFEGETERHPATIRTIGRALLWNPPEGKFTVRVYVDALSKTLRHTYGAQLRKFGLRVDNVQGVEKEESNATMRLADALAGLISDIEDGTAGKDLQELYEKGVKKGFITEV